MSQVIDDYLDEVAAHLRGQRSDKEQVLRELRSHLEEQLADLSAEDPHSHPDEIARHIVQDFGDPEDLALAYDVEGRPELQLVPSGETVLRLTHVVGRGAEVLGRGAQAVGRGTGTVLKWTAGILGVLLVLSILVGVWAFYEVRPYVEDVVLRNTEQEVFSLDETCRETACTFERPSQRFHVAEGARELRFRVDLWAVHDGSSDQHVLEGQVEIHVRDPVGTTIFSRTFVLGEEGSLSQRATWDPAPGDWRVDVNATGFQGHLAVEAATVGAPR